MKLKALVIANIITLTLLLPTTAMAQAYGDGNFGEDTYNGTLGATPTPTPSTVISPTPTPIAVINTPAGDLPVTGAGLTIATSIGALLIALGLIVWAKNRRKSTV